MGRGVRRNSIQERFTIWQAVKNVGRMLVVIMQDIWNCYLIEIALQKNRLANMRIHVQLVIEKQYTSILTNVWFVVLESNIA